MVGGGTLNPSTPVQVVDGGTTTYQITPPAGKTSFVLPPDSGAACSGTLDTSVTPNTYTVTPVTANCGFKVAFTVDEVASVTGGNGTISPVGTTGGLTPGSNTTVYTLTPDAGYSPVVGGTCSGVFNSAGNTFTVTNAVTDCTVVASFTNDPVHVTSSVSGGGGSIDMTGTINLPRGGGRVYTLTPLAGTYPLVTGNCSGTLVGNTYTVTPVNTDCAFSVSFTSSTVKVTAAVTSGTGTITPSGTSTIAAGGGQSFTAAPGAGNVTVFDGSSTCPGIRSGNVYNVVGATSDCAVNVKFVANAGAVTVSTTVSGGNGSVTTPGQDAAGNTVVAIGDTRVWTVTPASAGYIPKVLSSTCPAGVLSATAPYTYTVAGVTASCAVVFAFTVPSSTAAIPTLNEWGLLILSALLGLGVALTGARRRAL